METKVCGKCKQEKPVSEFHRSTRDRYRSRCKVCHKEDCKEYGANGYYREHAKEYYKRPEVKARVKAYVKEYRKRPDVQVKNFARHYTHNRIQNGEIIKEPCAFCRKEQVEAHHKDYSQPLLIVWLCSECHRKLHYSFKEADNG